MSSSKPGQAFALCVPHLPFLTIQSEKKNAPFWAAYRKQAAALAAFDPELVIAFGSDHYEGQHLKNMPTFMVGHAADAIADLGGFPGKLDVPQSVAAKCAEFLVRQEFDVSVSYAMTVDHGFSSVLHHSLGRIDARPVIPIFVNALSHPRPSLRRCRQFGAAVGRFASTLGVRVAFIGSGGLSHETGEVFPQINEARDPGLRDFLIHGDSQGSLSREQWRTTLNSGLAEVNELLERRVPGVGEVRQEWDQEFLRALIGSPDMTVFDAWEDAQILANAGNGGGEVREWIAALAAAHAAGAGAPAIDHYESHTCIGVAAVVVHAASAEFLK